ncbi:MAG TPA: phosphotransferase [Amnibacterium sp.]|nr:phosphotransferase [Amnibacterium sp.]
MHEGQWDLDVGTVGRIVADRYPAWAGLPVRPVASSGTVNALFRLGDEVVLRFPLAPDPEPSAVERIRAAQAVVGRLAPTVDVALPELLAVAGPHRAYPGWSSGYRWLPGDPVDPDAVPTALAEDLARFVRALQALPLEGRRWEGRWRGGPLAAVDTDVRAALAASAALVDVGPLEAVWADALGAPGPRAGTWIHSDLMPGNLLVRTGRLTAVLDCEDLAVGDPAVDLMPAWNLLSGAGRARFRSAVGPDEAAWRRGRGWALGQAILAVPYYVDTNPHMADTARRTLAALGTS